METPITITLTPQLMLQEQKKDHCLKHVRKWVKDKRLPDSNYHKINRILNSMANDFEAFKLDPINDLLLRLIPRQETKNDTCYGQYKICLPISLVIPAFTEAHAHVDAGHPGIQKTVEQIQTLFHFPGLYKWCKYLIKDCLKCQTNKNVVKRKTQTAPLLAPSRDVTAPLEKIHIDYKGPLHPPRLLTNLPLSI